MVGGCVLSQVVAGGCVLSQVVAGGCVLRESYSVSQVSVSSFRSGTEPYEESVMESWDSDPLRGRSATTPVPSTRPQAATQPLDDRSVRNMSG